MLISIEQRASAARAWYNLALVSFLPLIYISMSLELPEGRIVRRSGCFVFANKLWQDFVGQKLVNDIVRVGLSITTVGRACSFLSYPVTEQVVSFVAGFAVQDLRMTFVIYCACVGILTLVGQNKFHCSFLILAACCSAMAYVQPASCKMA